MLIGPAINTGIKTTIGKTNPIILLVLDLIRIQFHVRIIIGSKSVPKYANDFRNWFLISIGEKQSSRKSKTAIIKMIFIVPVNF
jgi:hypothetical protein